MKHIQSFQSLLEQLSTIGATLTNDDVVLSLMRYTFLSYKTFIIFMQNNQILQSIIIDFFKKKC